MDYSADTMYFLDIFIQFRTGYLEQGISDSFYSRLNRLFNRISENRK
jgi:hypothetical protein